MQYMHENSPGRCNYAVALGGSAQHGGGIHGDKQHIEMFKVQLALFRSLELKEEERRRMKKIKKCPHCYRMFDAREFAKHQFVAHNGDSTRVWCDDCGAPTSAHNKARHAFRHQVHKVSFPVEPEEEPEPVREKKRKRIDDVSNVDQVGGKNVDTNAVDDDVAARRTDTKSNGAESVDI
jgi:hypothetical protein